MVSFQQKYTDMDPNFLILFVRFVKRHREVIFYEPMS